jgi:predicted transcriptional regulator
MRTVTLGISSVEATRRRMAAAFEGRRQGAFLSFETVDLLWKVLTPNRWAILKAMAGKGPLTIRAVGELVGRDVKAVHTDVTALTRAGILERTEGGIVFPYDAVHVDFTLMAMA